MLYPSADEYERLGARMAPILNARGHYADDRIMKRANGEVFWCHVTGRALNRDAPHEAGIWAFEDLSSQRPVKAELTAREREVAARLLDGMTSKEIGKTLAISHRTVEIYRARLMRKYKASTTADLVHKLMAGDCHCRRCRRRAESVDGRASRIDVACMHSWISPSRRCSAPRVRIPPSQFRPTLSYPPSSERCTCSSPTATPPRELKDVPEDIKARVLEVQEKAGFVPNVFLALARRPAEWRAFFAYHDALMLKEEGSLTKGDREMIVTATSAANKCLYCVVAHGAILRIYEKKPLVADQVAVNYRKADITPRQRAMLDFAMKVCLHSTRSTMPISRRCTRTASPTRTSGTSPRSRPSSACRTGWRASPTCSPTPSST